MLFAEEHGHVVGATEGFLLLVKDGAVMVAGEQAAEVAGFAAATLAADGGRRVVEGTVRASDLLAADEVFLAGTSCGIIGITTVDGQEIGSGTEGPVTRSIREAYHRLTRE